MLCCRRLLLNVGARSCTQRRFASTSTPPQSYKVVVIGGGAGGLAVSSTLSEVLGRNAVAVVEPSAVHYNQPLWTFVGAGLKTLSDSAKPMQDVMPKNAAWIKSSVTKIDPKANAVHLDDGRKVNYDFLVVAPGIKLNWDQVKGLPEALGKNGVSSNYADNTVEKTWENIRTFRGGTAVFTMPSTPIKCPGAAVKIAYLAEDHIRKSGIRDRSRIIYCTGMGKIFSVDKYAAGLNRIAKEQGIEVNLSTDLVEVRGDKKEAVFKQSGTSETKTISYDMLHVVPPMGPPKLIADSGIANSTGWVDIDQTTMQHNRYPNIFSLGDASSAPTSKTAAAVASQSGVLKHNLLNAIHGKLNQVTAARYDGYTSCPLTVGRDKLILAEFSGYTLEPTETFPFDQGQERTSMYYLTKEIIPAIYWRGLLKGSWTGPAKVRRYLSVIP